MDQTQAAIEFGMGSTIELIAVVMAGIIFLLLMFGLVRFSSKFLKEWRYLNSEIARTDGKERRYYIRCKRKLLLSLLPFVRH